MDFCDYGRDKAERFLKIIGSEFNNKVYDGLHSAEQTVQFFADVIRRIVDDAYEVCRLAQEKINYCNACLSELQKKIDEMQSKIKNTPKFRTETVEQTDAKGNKTTKTVQVPVNQDIIAKCEQTIADCNRQAVPIRQAVEWLTEVYGQYKEYDDKYSGYLNTVSAVKSKMNTVCNSAKNDSDRVKDKVSRAIRTGDKCIDAPVGREGVYEYFIRPIVEGEV